MEESHLTFTMHAVLLATLVALCHWGPLGLSSADDRSQCCCDELDMLTKAFPEEDNECLVEDCTAWLMDIRASVTRNETSCPVPEYQLCEKFASQKSSRVKILPDVDWPASSHVTVKNILHVVDTQNWQNCVIVYDFKAWSALHLLTSSLSLRLIDFVIYNVTAVNGTSELRDMLGSVFGERDMRNVIVISAQLVFVHKLFREAEEYDVRLGRTSGLRMFTRWIVATSSGMEEQVARAATYFDNVVAVTENQDVVLFNTSGLINSKLQCVRTEVSTLMYVSNGRREFQSVTVLLPGGDLIVNDTFPNMRHGFNTRTLTVGTKDWEPFVIKSLDSSGVMRYTGLCIDLLNELASCLNFTYVIEEPPWQEGWGDQNASGYWEGLVGQLHREEVDLVVAPLSFTVERALVMDSTYPYATNNLAAIYRKPDPALYKWKTYLRPFRGEVLLCLAITLLLVTCLVQVMAWLNPAGEGGEEARESKGTDQKEKSKKKKKKREKFPGPSPDDGFWYLYGALLSQGGLQLPKSSSGRMLVASWWLFSIVMGATYSGNLIAFLTVQLETQPFHSLEEMLDQDTYIWGTVDKTATYRLLMESRNPVLKNIGIKLHEFAASDPDILNLDINVHLDKVMAGGYVHLTDSVSTEAWTRDNCELNQIIDHDSVGIPYTVNLPRGSAFTRLFNEYVMRIVEAGLLRKWKRDWFADSVLCVKSIVTESPKISVLDVQSVLYVGLIGFGLALIFLALEFLCHRHRKLLAWTNKLGESCVKGCEEEPGEKGSKENDGQHALGFRNNNISCSNNDGRTGRRLDELDFRSVFVVGERGDGERLPAGIFDFGSVDQRNRFLFDTVYSSPEDFGREPNDAAYRPDGDRRGSKVVRISDDVKIST